MKKVFLLVLLISCFALGRDFEDFAHKLVGYTIVDIKTVDGNFEGCDYDRKIVFTDGTYVTCLDYGYTYSYMPEAIIFGTKHNGAFLYKMYIDGELYDIR